MNIGAMSTAFGRRFYNTPAYVRGILLVITVSAITVAAYSNSFHATFHMDDGHQILANHHIRVIANIPRFFTESGLNTSQPEIDFYRPVTTSSFALNYALGKLNQSGYHIFNLTFHILNALLVFVIVRFVLMRSGYATGFLLPLAICIIFALHPIQVGAVTYISGRAVLLATFFSLSSLYAFMRYREADGPAAYFWGGLSPLLFLLGLLSKEMTFAALGLMLAYDLIYRPSGERGMVRAWLYYLCYAPCIGLFVWGWAAIGNKNPLAPVRYSHAEYIMSQAKILFMYVRLLFLPVNQNADYVLPVTTSVDLKVILSASLVAISLYGLYRIRKTMPAEAFFGFWFFIALLPESSFIRILDLAVEYRLYLPSVGFISLMVMLALRAMKKPAVTAAAFMAVLLFFGISTFNRNKVYANELVFWGDIYAKSPQSGRAARGYGDALIYAGRYQEAIVALKRAMALERPFKNPAVVFTNLGKCYYSLGRIKEAEESYMQAIKARPDFLSAYDSLGSMYFETGRYKDAAEIFTEETRWSSGNPTAEYNLGATLMMLNKNEDALEHMQNAFDYGLDNFDVHYNLALLYERTGQTPKARKHAEKALDMAGGEDDRFKAAQLISRLGG